MVTKIFGIFAITTKIRKKMNKSKTYKIGEIKLKISSNGYPCGLMLKRRLTLRECKHILKNLLGINLAIRDCFYDKEEYEDYNQELEDIVNEWLNGNLDDESIAEFEADCYPGQLGIFNMFPIAAYLLKINAI
jgi:hypothetical protein